MNLLNYLICLIDELIKQSTMSKAKQGNTLKVSFVFYKTIKKNNKARQLFHN